MRDYQKVMPEITGKIEPSDFYKTFHQELYRTMHDLFTTGKSINPTTALTGMKRQGKDYTLTEFKQLAEDCITVTGFMEYLERVKECSHRRQFNALLYDLQKANNEEMPTESLFTEASRKINTLMDSNRESKGINAERLSDALPEYIDLLDKNRETGLSGPCKIKTSFPEFDQKTMGGLPKGHLIYLGGRPSMGKSTLSLQWALNIARNGKTVYYCSFEIPRTDLITKIICLRNTLPAADLETKIHDETFCKVTNAAGKLSELPFYFSCQAITPLDILLQAQQIKNTTGSLDLLVIDRLEIIKDQPKHGENRTLQLGRISQELNKIALSMGVPLLCLVQLSRQAARRGSEESHCPILSDIRDSGALEQDAKMVLFVHREDMYRPERQRDGKGLLIIAKSMFGRTGFIDLLFRESIPMFSEVFQ